MTKGSGHPDAAPVLLGQHLNCEKAESPDDTRADGRF
jgi:hypothetical protein